jgi:hypothetical protein
MVPKCWQRVNIEFEFESRNFRDHGHPLTSCDVIVCWHHNWPDCPAQIEVLELFSRIKSLRNSEPNHLASAFQNHISCGRLRASQSSAK